jgi:hypothetical protein
LIWEGEAPQSDIHTIFFPHQGQEKCHPQEHMSTGRNQDNLIMIST